MATTPRVRMTLALLAIPALLAAQRGAPTIRFPAGRILTGRCGPRRRSRGCSRRTPTPSTRFSSPGSESFRIKFLPEETRVGATELVNATRGGSEGSDVEVYDPRTGQPLKFTYEHEAERSRDTRDSRGAADSGAAGRRRPRPDLQDLQGSAHLHDARRRHRVGAQPQRLSPRRAAAERVRVHLVERRGAADNDGGWTAEAGVRESERAEQPGDDSRAKDAVRRSRRATTSTCSSTTSGRSTTSTRPRRDGSAVEQIYSDYRKGAAAKLDSLAYLALQDLQVVDLDTAAPLTTARAGRGPVGEVARCRSRTTGRARI